MKLNKKKWSKMHHSNDLGKALTIKINATPVKVKDVLRPLTDTTEDGFVYFRLRSRN